MYSANALQKMMANTKDIFTAIKQKEMLSKNMA